MSTCDFFLLLSETKQINYVALINYMYNEKQKPMVGSEN